MNTVPSKIKNLMGVAVCKISLKYRFYMYWYYITDRYMLK